MDHSIVTLLSQGSRAQRLTHETSLIHGAPFGGGNNFTRDQLLPHGIGATSDRQPVYYFLEGCGHHRRLTRVKKCALEPTRSTLTRSRCSLMNKRRRGTQRGRVQGFGEEVLRQTCNRNSGETRLDSLGQCPAGGAFCHGRLAASLRSSELAAWHRKEPLMGSILRNTFVASLAALTIAAGTSAVPGTTLACKGGRLTWWIRKPRFWPRRVIC